MTEDLVKWLRARLDEDERAAREAAPAPWTYQDVDSVGGGRVCDQTVAIASMHYDSPGEVDPRIRRSVMPAEADATGTHIVRWDPARVLVEVDAKRRIIAEYERYAAERRRAMNGWESSREISPILAALALPYADRDGYRPEWRPA